MKKNRFKLFVVDLEPTPYKFDLWNTFSESLEFDVNVIYTQSRDWSPDAGHSYHQLPKAKHDFYVFEGNSLASRVAILCSVIRQLNQWQPDYVYIAGYVNFVQLVTLFFCVLTRRKYMLHSDVFNLNKPLGAMPLLKQVIRDRLRHLIFKTAAAILVCGHLGHASAIAAKCPSEKLIDFPYVFDIKRISADTPIKTPSICMEDIESNTTIIFFSGRMISRKGLDTLLMALSHLVEIDGWVLWIEGDGPMLSYFQDIANKLGISYKCRFLGFSEMTLHSWLIRSSDIVVVPSSSDSWGIVVDEGMQLGKTVISSNAVGSGADRIVHGNNGLIFRANQAKDLTNCLRTSISDQNYRQTLGKNAMQNKSIFTPIRNVSTLYNFLIKKENSIA